MKLVAPKRTLLRAIHPNVGNEMAYRKAIWSFMVRMHNDLIEMLAIHYPPPLAQDANPVEGIAKAALKAKLKQFGLHWEGQINLGATSIVNAFATGAMKATDVAFQAALRDAGFSVRFQFTPAMMERYEAIIKSNMDLITSIPKQYMEEVEAMVMESVKGGRAMGKLMEDLHGMVKLERKLGEADKSLLARTQRRIELIARTENNKASAKLNQGRQVELGITTAIWMHSGAGKDPRPEHEEANGTEYDVEEGLPIGDDGEDVLPGECINCRCFNISVIPGLEDEIREANAA